MCVMWLVISTNLLEHEKVNGLDLDQPNRLIFEPHEDPIPTDGAGKYIWLEIKGVEIIEITNYHGK